MILEDVSLRNMVIQVQELEFKNLIDDFELFIALYYFLNMDIFLLL